MTSRRQDEPASSDSGPFVLRTLLDDVPLSQDGSSEDIKINCVDYLDQNLYIGTTASELLHFVQLPTDPNGSSELPTFILASRIVPPFHEPQGAVPTSRPGVQQILLLPQVGKACVLCNWTVTFYGLPELSPAFDNTQVKNCTWIGGVDLNEPAVENAVNGVTILLSLNRRIQVVRIGEDARVSKKIDFAASKLTVRRDSIACVADAKAYSLLDVERQLKIPLMNISTQDSPPSGDFGHRQSLAPGNAGQSVARRASSSQNRPTSSTQGHSRSTSLGGAILSNIRRPGARTEDVEDATFQDPSPPDSSAYSQPSTSPDATPSVNKPLPAAPRSSSVFLKPHIVSPSQEEFLLATGTSPRETGIGMFVNLDGDPTRPPLEFKRYPREIVVDMYADNSSSQPQVFDGEEVDYVLASMVLDAEDGPQSGIEVQRLDTATEEVRERHWLAADGVASASPYGIRLLSGSNQTHFQEITERLCQRKFSPFPGPVETLSQPLKRSDSRTALSMERLNREKELVEQNLDSENEESLPEGWDTTRNAEEEEFARRFAQARPRLAVWSGKQIWWAIRNPLIIRLDAELERARRKISSEQSRTSRFQELASAVLSIQGREPRTELEFMTFAYMKQKTGLLLLTNMLLSDHEDQRPGADIGVLESLLLDSKLDPRVVLSLVPGVRNEIINGQRGIWIYGGVQKVAETFLRSAEFMARIKIPPKGLQAMTLHFLRRFLANWRKMKGFGSVPDENEVFRTVDAALLVVLLELDRRSLESSGADGAVRAELNELVDKGVDCFDRAVDLLKSYHRLFVLSRLYQSRKMAADVLATWKHIIEGARDDGNELQNGEHRVKDYLTKISSQALVKEYGVWLARRNPKLSVQVFADSKGRAARFEVTHVVDILRGEAPEAVKYYLEHLVFGKGHTAYVNDLIAYYLDIVVGGLLDSPESRDMVMTTYATYRALQPPKPTYIHFLTDNAPPDDELWHSRLRLLQLLGGSHTYDALKIRARIDSLPGDLLVPEIIILAGRERQHDDAVRLLVHQLGDYDTAISYCLRGGLSIYTPQNDQRHGALTVNQQKQLFGQVLREFLTIEDMSARIEQSGSLLDRFGQWFDIEEVLGLIPDTWSVSIVAGFLVGAIRRLVRQRHESMIRTSLSRMENLRVAHDLVIQRSEQDPIIEASS